RRMDLRAQSQVPRPQLEAGRHQPDRLISRGDGRRDAAMAKRNKPALPDWHLWTEVAQTVSPLHRSRIREALNLAEAPLPLPKAPPAPRSKPIKLPPAMPSYQSSGKPGRQANQVIEPKLKRKLTRGRIDIDGTIDLHGMRQA